MAPQQDLHARFFQHRIDKLQARNLRLRSLLRWVNSGLTASGRRFRFHCEKCNEKFNCKSDFDSHYCVIPPRDYCNDQLAI